MNKTKLENDLAVHGIFTIRQSAAHVAEKEREKEVAL